MVQTLGGWADNQEEEDKKSYLRAIIESAKMVFDFFLG